MKKLVKFIGGLRDGETYEVKDPLPRRWELWPESNAQKAKRDATRHLCTACGSQIYEIDESGKLPKFRVVRPTT